jgi:CRP-like cAMP-binding protein
LSELVKSAPLFSCLNSTQLQSLCKHCRIIKLAEGDSVFHQGDRVYQFYFVIEGLIKLYRQSSDGQEKVFELEGPGKTFAEALMFLSEDTYPVSATAMTTSRLLAVHTHEYLKILQESPESCLLMMGNLSRRLHQLIAEIDQLSLHSGRNRVATFLLDLYHKQGDGFELGIPKSVVASMLSLQPETFSRLLKELRSKGIIEVRENRVRVLDEQQLRAHAGIA